MAMPTQRAMIPDARPRVPRQRGAVLIVGLVILLVVTMVGIGGQQSTVLQERMAGNMRQNNIAFQAAEAALQLALSYLEEQAQPITPDDAGTHFVWTSCTVDDADAGRAACGRLQDDVLTNWKKAPAAVKEGTTYGAMAAALDGADPGSDADAYKFPDVIADPHIYIEVREDRYFPDTQANSFGEQIMYFYTVTSIGFGTNEQARAILQSTIARVYQ